jgi:DNA-binding GntR family transcriptional regulator
MSDDVLPTELKLREKAYHSFTERLLAKAIRPGQFISQRELVAITGMPLGAIRELVPRLEAEGLIKTVPQRGMQIAHIDLDLIRNAFQLRLILEKEAVASFAASASDAEIEALRAEHSALMEHARRGIDEGLVARAQTIDWAFHDTLIDRLGNEIISKVYRVNSLRIRLISQERVRIFPELVTTVVEEHTAILEALARRDALEAAAAMEAHIASARRRALRV